MARKPPPPEEGAPLWMCTYGDLMSLLLCFFIMLFAISIIAEIKYEALVETLNKEFGYSGSSKTKSKGKATTMAPSSPAERSRRTAALTGGQPTPGPQGPAPNVMSLRLTGELVKGGIVLFELGNDELTDAAKDGLDDLFPLLAGSPNKIQLTGHAGPTEVGEGRLYKEDTALAHYRASSVRDYLVSLGLKREYFILSSVDSLTLPNPGILPAGVAPNQAGASVEIMLLDQTQRQIKENPEQWTEAPVQ